MKKLSYIELDAKIIKKFQLGSLLVVTVFLFCVSAAQAATYTAASCSASAVQTAMNQATKDGDIVSIPGGTCYWSSGVSWSPPPNATLKGAGSTSIVGGNDQTIIADNYSNSNGALLRISVQSSGTFRMYGITFENGSGGLKNSGMIQLHGPGTVRLDHLHIDITTGVSNRGKYLYVGKGIRGVLDSSIIDVKNINWIHIVNGSDFAGDEEWSEPSGFGTSDFFFIEDCEITGTGSNEATLTDCHTGGKYVARYNYLTDSGIGQTHPTGHAGDDRGCRAHEIYGNTLVESGDGLQNWALDSSNSGTQMVWGNSVSGNVVGKMLYWNYVRSQLCTTVYGATSWGYATVSNAWDGGGSGGYPALDQPGRGVGDLISGTFGGGDRINTTTGTAAWPNQALEPMYEWLNTGSVSNYVSSYCSSTIIQENRDYYLYHNNTSCNQGAGSCTSGIGSGTRAQRPTSCTTGVAWWSTDKGGNWNTSNADGNDGTLDVCIATNTWSNAYYTPYTYPHPLRDGGVAPEPATPIGDGDVTPEPDPPKNLRIIN